MIAVRDLDLPPAPGTCIYPGVVIDGQTYTPEGWMWLLAFAMRGQPWAIKQLAECDPVTISPIDIYRWMVAAARLAIES